MIQNCLFFYFFNALSSIKLVMAQIELLWGQGAQTIAGAIISVGCVHFLLCVTLITHGVIFFAYDVTLEQIFVDPTYCVKIELQDMI